MRVWVVLGHEGWGENTAVDSVFTNREAAFAYYEANRRDSDQDAVWYVILPTEHEVVAPAADALGEALR